MVVADGRGTPGRGPACERAVHGDLAAPVLDDQVDALHAVAARAPRPRPVAGRHPRLVVRRLPRRAGRAAPPGRLPRRGRGRAGHRLGALRHPLHRALPRPPRRRTRRRTRRSSLVGTRRRRRGSTRPLLLVHGLADDNVVAAHTLRLSSALLAAGRPHSVLPLSGVTHMTPQEVVAENLLLLQVRLPQGRAGLSQAASGMCSAGSHGVSPRRLPARHSAIATPSATTIETTAAAREIAAAARKSRPFTASRA